MTLKSCSLISPPISVLIIITLLLLLHGSANSQIFNGNGGVIPNNGNTGTFNLPVSGLTPSVIDTVYGLEYVSLNIIHPADGELRIELISPAGEKITLTDGFGGDGDNFTNTIFKDFVEGSVFSGNPPYTGEYRPVENIGYLNNTMPGNGTWNLKILDMNPGSNGGTLLNWSLKFSNTPGKPFPFDSTNLPLILIDTYGEVIPDDPKILVSMKVIDNGPGNFNRMTDVPVYDYYAGIEIRGSSSQMFLKKSYGLETWDAQQNIIDTSMLGMPSESDWILNANYTDKTLLRNVMAYQTFMNLGHYATRYRFVELWINDRYKGVYIFSEKIKRDNDRVDIEKLTPEMNFGDELTGGYILKIDKQTGSGGQGFPSSFPPPHHPIGQYIFFQYEYPNPEEITAQQKNYIYDYIRDFETALDGPSFSDPDLGFRKYAVEETFINYFIVNEVSKNVDGYRLSTFLHKERDSKGGRIRMGPVWDYDLAWHNADYCEGDNYTGWGYQFPCDYDWWQVPFWWERLLQDTLYANNLKCRWLEARSSFLSNDSVFGWIDNMVDEIYDAQQRNFQCWPILGIYVWPNPWPYPETYDQEIASMKDWISARYEWLDEHMPGNCWTLSSASPTATNILSVFPNPSTNKIYMRADSYADLSGTLKIIDPMGREMIKIERFRLSEPVDISKLPCGPYLVRLTHNSGILTSKFIKINNE